VLGGNVSENPAVSRNNGEEDLMARVDTSVPVSARIWNYWMGGDDYYPVDKEAGDAYAQLSPGVFDLARSSRDYLIRAVRYLAGDLGVRQFLDIGSGLPSHDPTHEVAQGVAPESRVVYADNDPLVLAHARALLAGNPNGGTDYIEADLYDPGTLLSIARTKLDFTQPVAIMLMGVMGHIGNPAENNDEVGRSIVDQLKDALPSGGYLVMYEGIDTDPAQDEALDQYNESGAVPYRVRRPEQVILFFDGLEVAEPGVVPIHQWRPDPGAPEAPEVPALGGVGKKP
jgi:S-adenosyl methyltransferase